MWALLKIKRFSNRLRGIQLFSYGSDRLYDNQIDASVFAFEEKIQQIKRLRTAKVDKRPPSLILSKYLLKITLFDISDFLLIHLLTIK